MTLVPELEALEIPTTYGQGTPDSIADEGLEKAVQATTEGEPESSQVLEINHDGEEGGVVRDLPFAVS